MKCMMQPCRGWATEQWRRDIFSLLVVVSVLLSLTAWRGPYIIHAICLAEAGF